MNTLNLDPALLMQEATQGDLVRRKMDMDALRQRFGDQKTQQQKLRESCEGFEAIFLQKMWEQMRQTVPKEGLLHSKDQEMYQSMFDVELSKKMASAGGIGLADMLYVQLSQQLENTGRNITPSAAAGSYSVGDTDGLGLAVAQTKPEETLQNFTADAKGYVDGSKLAAAANKYQNNNIPDTNSLNPANLYSPLPDSSGETDSYDPYAEAEEKSGPLAEASSELKNLSGALNEMKAELAMNSDVELRQAAAAWAEERAAMTGGQLPTGLAANLAAGGNTAFTLTSADGNNNQDITEVAPSETRRANAVKPSGNSAGGLEARELAAGMAAPASNSQDLAASAAKTGLPAQQVAAVNRTNVDDKVAQNSWQKRSVISAKPKPITSFSTNKKNTPPEVKEQTQPGLAPDGSVWPFEGVVTSRFGWEDDPLSGKRRWNSGVQIAGPANTPVRAVLDGTVVYVGEREGFGHSVVVEHKGNLRSYYGNLEQGNLKIGDKIKRGSNFAQVTAQVPVNENGEKTSSLFFEIKRGEMALNPENAIRRLSTASR